MKHLLLITASLVLLAGCGKQESPAPAAAPKPPPTMPSLQPAEIKPAGPATPSQPEAPKVPILNTKMDLEVLT
ncbi:MAG: hypothetical protein HYZ36_04110, partial [Pedosphaera parvula]|nr:hypothetical protein [Pedosphaera parvula]